MPLDAKIGEYTYNLVAMWVPDTHTDDLDFYLPAADTIDIHQMFRIEVDSCTQKVDCGA